MSKQAAVQFAIQQGQAGTAKSKIMKELVSEYDLMTSEVAQILAVTHPGTTYQVVRNTLLSAGLHRTKDGGSTGGAVKNGFAGSDNIDTAALLAKLG